MNVRTIRAIRNIHGWAAYLRVPVDKVFWFIHGVRQLLDICGHNLSLGPMHPASVVFILERSEFELIGKGYVGAALQNGCGLGRKSGGERWRATAISKPRNTMPEFKHSHWCTIILSEVKRGFKSLQCAPGSWRKLEGPGG